MAKLSPEQETRLEKYLEMLGSVTGADAPQLRTIARTVYRYTDDATPLLMSIMEHDNTDAGVLAATIMQISNCPVYTQPALAAVAKKKVKETGIKKFPLGILKMLKSRLPKARSQPMPIF